MEIVLMVVVGFGLACAIGKLWDALNKINW